MRNKPPYVSPKTNQGNNRALPAELSNEILALFNAGLWEQLVGKATAVTVHYPQNLLGWKALGKGLYKLNRFQEAIEALSRVLKIAPTDADTHNDLGFVHYLLGQRNEAEASYRHAIKCNPRYPEAYSNLGNLLTDLCRFDDALKNYQQSLEINPNSADTHNNIGCLQRNLGQLNEAVVSYRRALELNPNYFEACLNLGLILTTLVQWDEAQVCYRRALQMNPNSDIALLSLGTLLGHFDERTDEAIACFERSIALNPGNADTYIALGNILMRIGQHEKSSAMLSHAQQLRPFISWTATKVVPDFSVLLLDTPGAGCTPVNYLVGRGVYDSHFYCLTPEAPQDLDLLRSKGNVLINMISDADNGRDMLPLALDLVERLGIPTVNHPRVIMQTDRESVAKTLAGTPLCRIPKTVRLTGQELAEAAHNNNLMGLTMPILVRVAGGHGGDDFLKPDDFSAIIDFVAKQPEASYYLTEYVDYRSSDGLFRKYRLISLNGEILPYHLAIHDDWMVHHFRTDMANQVWMREEEEAFLKDPLSVFDAPHQAALQTLAAKIGLDYCGIDCALDRNGDIVVFELNATMRVHDETNPTFTYKNPYIAKIKSAFDLMLAQKAKEDHTKK